MAYTLNELSTRLLARFKDVPNVDVTDTTEWTQTAMNDHGFADDESVPAELSSLVLLYAQADGSSQIALRTAFYFSYQDGDESVDKSKVSDQYRKLADELWKRYAQKKSDGVGEGSARIGGSHFYTMPRADRR